LARRPPDAIRSPPVARSGYRDVPPDVTTGWVVVVVGGLVVVVVGGIVVVVTGGLVVGVVVAAEPGELDPAFVGGVVVGVVVVVVVVLVPTVAGCAVVGADEGVGALVPADDPGFSLATVTQMNAVAPPASTMAVLVRRLMRACARARAVGEYMFRTRLMPDHGREPLAPARARTRGPRRTTAYGPNLKNS
jgi:hypothetical protein